MKNSISLSYSEGKQLVDSGIAKEYKVYIPYFDGTIWMGNAYISGEPTGEELSSLFDEDDIQDSIESLEHDCSGKTPTSQQFLEAYQQCLENPELVEFWLIPRSDIAITPPAAFLVEELVQEQLDKK